MFVVSVMYPTEDDTAFDFDYYMKTHIPMVQSLWTAFGVRDIRVLRGTGAPGGGQPAYLAIAHLTFPSASDFEKAVAQHGQEVMGDIPKFTNIKPLLQFSELLT
ncbi:EthD family reductase [Limobrevibacterium gyesilva]|uniref:EthD family reductase n=1 Tax=Limobrevibacterium gyesilva TaxID=2991712 RepID=A0AA41YPP0_9PROT|nr:EthD family reductase [Limobrevibacterium gyesilva]MCW3473247.1 EthD family reductase [Limobrevibacterium gyesilva]